MHGEGATTDASTRIHGLDALRGVLMMLGILIHCSLAYMPHTGWPFVDWTATSWNLNLVTDGVHMFRMPAFFLLSGFFGALLWKHRGARGMLKNRVARIVLPFAVFVVLLHPITAFCFSFGEGVKGDAAVPIQGALDQLWVLAPPDSTLHLWFLYDLIFVTAISAAIVAIMGRLGLRWSQLLRGVRRVLESPWLFVIVLGGLNFAWCAALDWTDIPTEGTWVPEDLTIIAYYLLWYGLGWMVFASGAVLSTCKERAWTLVFIGVVCVVVRHLARGHLEGPTATQEGIGSVAKNSTVAENSSTLPGQHLFEALGDLVGWLPPPDSGIWELGGAFWTSLGLVAFIRGLTGLFLRYAGSGKPFWRYISDSSYWVYLLHLPLTVVVPSVLLGWQVPVFIKYPVSVLLVLGMCWLSYDCLIRPTVVGRFLNGRRYPARNRRLSGIGTFLAFGWLGASMAFYPPPIDRPPPWRNGLDPSELLPGETIVYPVSAVGPGPNGVTMARCVGVQPYILCTDKASPGDVDAACAALGASVAIYETAAEQDQVSRLASTLTASPFWVAVTDTDVEGEWRWPDGRLVSHEPWHEGEPNNWGGLEDCAALNWGGVVKWNDLPCDARLGFICEHPNAKTHVPSGEVE
jgi:glucan biosynthesis protein C